MPDIPSVIGLPTSYEELPRYGNHFKLLKHDLCFCYHRHKSYYLLFRPDYSTLCYFSTTGCCIPRTIVKTWLLYPFLIFFSNTNTTLSFLFQLIVAILFVIIGGLNINKERDQRAAIVLNDSILIFIFLISVVNIVISGFGLEYSNQPLKLISGQQQSLN